ncbi:pentatricopeptide repeat-containing protein At1g26460, mitochondrial [Cornus florida]|uniref:pentatricopeptide repeat-containing protein At1g26460, mitochondrial n=1 Tax=Cornus florida TaxID=4283 RepID=UPI002896EB53|nr:pentatricopeptide repeat-containing protein At1g26460, mitochondrial [Cornus florida]XP_059648774.1 pentatricopeptide repeat-containing protein At1g26460, mitochondrial [Cornus florida]
MVSMAILARSRPFIKNLSYDSIKSITTFTFLRQEPQLAESPPPPPPPQSEAAAAAAAPPPPQSAPPPQSEAAAAPPPQSEAAAAAPPPQSEAAAAPPPPQSEAPLPPNPASGSPLYSKDWRNPVPNTAASLSQEVIPIGFINQLPIEHVQLLSKNLDVPTISNVFADWMTSQRWKDMKKLFEFWVKWLDTKGKPNQPDVNLYNQYLRANLMIKASAAKMLDLVAEMENYGIMPNTASFNLVLKAMYESRESVAAEKLLQRMLQTGRESQPDDESYDLVIGLLFLTHQIDTALKYTDLNLKSGQMLSVNVFNKCAQSCVRMGRLDTLVSIIERCKEMEQNKALSPPWNLCINIADVAVQEDNGELAFYALEFLAKWINRGEKARPLVMLSVDEGLVVSLLGTASRTYNSKLLEGSWEILKRSLRQKKPNAESYLAKISAYASLGNLKMAFSTLHEFETTYANSTKEAEEDLFSPFSSLYPLVVACTKNGFVTLDSVYYQLENLRQADRPYTSVAALNCVILGCANIWDVDRAYQTFNAIGSSFDLMPDIHSYNSLMHAFGKLNKTIEASSVFEHLISKGVTPNAMTYSLLVDAHLIKRDPKAALSVIDEMVNVGYVPSKETLKKVRRRCIREMDRESNDKVEFLAKKFNIILGSEKRRNMLFNLEYSTDYA